MPARSGLLCGLLSCCCAPLAVAWTVTPRGALVLDAGDVTGIDGLSGVAYVGLASEGLHRFLAVQDTGNQLITFDVALNSDGSLGSAAAVSKTMVSPGFDFEGIVFNGPVRNSVYVSEETTPSVHEHDLATGNQIASLSIPSVFTHTRANRGFESLARNASTGVIWTANEEALLIDGPTATTTTGTFVRLQQFVEGDISVSPTAQFAYYVDPIHAGTIVDSRTRSGLSELVSLPDGTLLALERSLAVVGQFGATPIYQYQNRIYQIGFAGATDVSSSQFDPGLVGQTFTPVAKTPLWSGQAGAGILGSGENLEGLAFGPQLANGNWSLLGVVDGGGSADVLSKNTIVAFELASPTCALPGDYNCSGEVNQADYLAWKSLYSTVGQSSADGNGNAIVDAADYTVWRDHLSTSVASLTPIPEPKAIWFAWFSIAASVALTRQGAGRT